jgi:transporter family-2 protein
MTTLAVPFLLAVGGLLALQAAANVQLAGSMRSPLGGAAAQLSIGAAVLVTLAVLLGSIGALERLGEVPVWHLAGGVGSAIYVLAGILVLPRLGAIVSVGLFVAGQMLGSVVLDGAGWLGVQRDLVGAAVALGVAAVIAGALLIVRAQAGSALEEAVRGRGGWIGGWIAVAVGAGAVLPAQGAINAQLRGDLEAPLATGAWSFIVAASTMLVVLAAALALSEGTPRPRAPSSLPWWGWLGGFCGAAYVTAVFLLIPEIGVAPTVALTVAGQQLASVAVDRHGLLRLPRREVSAARLAGVALLLAGVVLIQAG